MQDKIDYNNINEIREERNANSIYIGSATSLRNPPFPLPPPPPKAKEEKKNSNENILIRTFFRGSNIKELLSYFFNVYLKANYYFIFTFSFISFLFNFYVCFLSLSSFYLYAHKNSVYSTFSV